MTSVATLLLKTRQIVLFILALGILIMSSCSCRQDSAGGKHRNDVHSNVRKSGTFADSSGPRQHRSGENNVADASASAQAREEIEASEGREPARGPSPQSAGASAGKSHAAGRAATRGRSAGIDSSQARNSSLPSRVEVESADIAERRGKELLAEADKAADDDDSAEAFRAALKAWEITRGFAGDPECQAIARRALQLTEIHGEAVNRSVGHSSDGKRITVE